MTAILRASLLPNSLYSEISADNGKGMTSTPATSGKAKSVSMQIGCEKIPATHSNICCKQATSKLPLSSL